MPDLLHRHLNRTAPARVNVTSLSLHDFRNYPSLNLRLSSPFVVLTGANGAGKTNLLEAVSLLTSGRGLRHAAFDEITRHGAAAGWVVAATLGRDGEETRVGTGLAAGPAGTERTRKVKVNGAAATGPDALLDYLRVLWLTPAMDGLFTGPASERRRFLDRLVLTVDPGHARRARDLERLLTQRNRLLEEGAASAWLDAVEAELAERAVAVALARAETTGLLAARVGDQAAAPEFPALRIGLLGGFDRTVAERSAADAEVWYRRALATGRGADRAAGRTLEGPHRSDLEVSLAGKNMPAALSSTGEQKALLIGLVLAHAELVGAVSGIAPVLLLDEVAAHLDPTRRRALFARLAALGCQAFMTGADPALFAGIPASTERFIVAENKILPDTHATDSA